MKLYFPQILQWFQDVSSPLVADLLQRWPDLQQLQRAHPGTLRKFFHQHNCRGAEAVEERIQAIYRAIPATNDPAVWEAGTRTAHGLVALLAVLRSNIAVLDQRITELVSSHPDGALFASLPGAGDALVPRQPHTNQSEGTEPPPPPGRTCRRFRAGTERTTASPTD